MLMLIRHAVAMTLFFMLLMLMLIHTTILADFEFAVDLRRHAAIADASVPLPLTRC